MIKDSLTTPHYVYTGRKSLDLTLPNCRRCVSSKMPCVDTNVIPTSWHKLYPSCPRNPMPKTLTLVVSNNLFMPSRSSCVACLPCVHTSTISKLAQSWPMTLTMPSGVLERRVLIYSTFTSQKSLHRPLNNQSYLSSTSIHFLLKPFEQRA